MQVKAHSFKISDLNLLAMFLKRIFFLTLLLVFIVHYPVIGQNITITSPSAGDDFLPDSTMVITWNSDSGIEKVGIVLLNESGQVEVLIDSLTENTGVKEYPIPDELGEKELKVEIYAMVDHYPNCVTEGGDPPVSPCYYRDFDVADTSGAFTIWDHQIEIVKPKIWHIIEDSLVFEPDTLNTGEQLNIQWS